MIQRSLSLAAAGVAGALFLVGPSGVGAQQEEQPQCELAPSEAASQAQSLINEARAAEQGGDEEAMAAKYREALAAVQDAMGGDDAAAVILAAQAHIGLGEHEVANDLLDRFETMVPACSEPARTTRYNAWVDLFNAAINAYREGDPERALGHFERANLIYQDPRSLNNAAALHLQQGNNEEAIELYRQALETDGDREQLRAAASGLTDLLSAEGREEEVVASYEAYLEEHPDDAVIRARHALALIDADREEEALPVLEEVLASESLSDEDFNQVGVALFNAERYPMAVEAFGRANQANPQHKEALENLVTAMIQAESYADAKPLAERLVERYPYEPVNYQLLANTLARTGEAQEALRTMQRGESLPISFAGLRFFEAAEGRYTIEGTVTAGVDGAGRTWTLPFQLVGPDGTVVAAAEAEIEAPPAGESSSFRVTLETEQEVAGFRYQQGASGQESG